VDTELSDCRPRFKILRRLITEGRVAAPPIVKHFEVFKDLLPGFLPCAVLTMMNEFPFQRAEEAPHTDIIPAVPRRDMLPMISAVVRQSW